MTLEWMAWTRPTAIFFVAIALLLASMTVWEILSPSIPRKGFLPIETTRGDRLFVGLLGSAYIHLGWLASTQAPLWVAGVIALVWMICVMRWG